MLLGAEYLLLTVLLDGQSIAHTSLGYWFSKVHHLPAILLCVLTSLAFLHFERFRLLGTIFQTQLSTSQSTYNSRTLFLRPVLLQILLFFVLLVLSILLFQQGVHPSSRGLTLGLMVFWGSLVVLTGVVSMAFLVPLRPFLKILWENKTTVLVGFGLGLVVWRVGLWGAQLLWDSLGQHTMASSAVVLSWFVKDVVYEPSQAALGTVAFGVHVAPECSGLEGIGLMVVFLTFFLMVSRKHVLFPRAFLLFPISVLLIWGLNVLRITSLILIGVWWSPKVALGGFHSKAGWVVFCLLALGIAYLTLRTSLFLKPNSPFYPKNLGKEDLWNPTAAYLLPLMSWIGVMLVLGMLQTHTLDRLYAVRIPITIIVLWWFASYWKSCQLALSWEAIGTGVLVYLVWIVAFQEPSPDTSLAWLKEFQKLPGMEKDIWIVSRLVGSVLVIPIVEELAFRGFLLRRLLSADFTEVRIRSLSWFPFLASSLAFGWMHQSWIAGSLAGFGFAWVYSRRGLLMDAIVAHAITNLLVAFHVMSTHSWSLWM